MEPCGGEWLKGKIVLFSLTNGRAKIYQVDSHRKPEAMEGGILTRLAQRPDELDVYCHQDC